MSRSSGFWVGERRKREDADGSCRCPEAVCLLCLANPRVDFPPAGKSAPKTMTCVAEPTYLRWLSHGRIDGQLSPRTGTASVFLTMPHKAIPLPSWNETSDQS